MKNKLENYDVNKNGNKYLLEHIYGSSKIVNPDEKYLLEHVYRSFKIIDPKKTKYEKHDYVRIGKHGEALFKRYTPKW